MSLEVPTLLRESTGIPEIDVLRDMQVTALAEFPDDITGQERFMRRYIAFSGIGGLQGTRQTIFTRGLYATIPSMGEGQAVSIRRSACFIGTVLCPTFMTIEDADTSRGLLMVSFSDIESLMFAANPKNRVVPNEQVFSGRTLESGIIDVPVIHMVNPYSDEIEFFGDGNI